MTNDQSLMTKKYQMMKGEGARGAAGVHLSWVLRQASGIVALSPVVQRKAPYG